MNDSQTSKSKESISIERISKSLGIFVLLRILSKLFGDFLYLDMNLLIDTILG